MQDIVDEVKARVPADGRLAPEAIVKPKPSEATMARVRAKVERLMRGAYSNGASTAVSEIEQALEQPIKRTAPEPAD